MDALLKGKGCTFLLIHNGAVNTGQENTPSTSVLSVPMGFLTLVTLAPQGEIKKAPISSRLRPVFLTASSFARVAAASMGVHKSSTLSRSEGNGSELVVPRLGRKKKSQVVAICFP